MTIASLGLAGLVRTGDGQPDGTLDNTVGGPLTFTTATGISS